MDEPGHLAVGIDINDQLNAAIGIQPVNDIFFNDQGFVMAPSVVPGPEPELFPQCEDQLKGIVAMEGGNKGGVEHRRDALPEI